jgi:hypothetical protein
MISTLNFKIIKPFIESVFFTLIIDIGSYLIRLFVLLFIININIVCMKTRYSFFYHYVLLVDSALQLLDYLNKFLHHLYQDFLLFLNVEEISFTILIRWTSFRFMDQFYYAFCLFYILIKKI